MPLLSENETDFWKKKKKVGGEEHAFQTLRPLKIEGSVFLCAIFGFSNGKVHLHSVRYCVYSTKGDYERKG